MYFLSLSPLLCMLLSFAITQEWELLYKLKMFLIRISSNYFKKFLVMFHQMQKPWSDHLRIIDLVIQMNHVVCVCLNLAYEEAKFKISFLKYLNLRNLPLIVETILCVLHHMKYVENHLWKIYFIMSVYWYKVCNSKLL